MSEELNNEAVEPTENNDEELEVEDINDDGEESFDWKSEAAKWRAIAKRREKGGNTKETPKKEINSNPSQFSPTDFLKVMELKEQGIQNKYIQQIFDRGPEILEDEIFIEGIKAKNNRELEKKAATIKGTSGGGTIHDKELQSKIKKMSSDEYREYLEKTGKA